jgi:ankyrin repeat protein
MYKSVSDLGPLSLALACVSGDLGGVRARLPSNTKIDIQNIATAWLMASFHGSMEPMDSMTKTLMTLNARDPISGDTPLMLASKAGRISIVKKLLAYECNVDVANKYGETAIMMAASLGHLHIVKKLLQYKVQDTYDVIGDSPLLLAAYHGHTAVVSALLENDWNVNHSNNYGATALMLAASKGHARVVAYLLVAHASVDTVDNDGNTALMLAAQSGFPTAVQALLTAGANVNLINARGASALMLAVIGNHAPVVRRLLDAGADIKLLDYDDLTAYQMAWSKEFHTVAGMIASCKQDEVAMASRIAVEGALPAISVAVPATAAKLPQDHEVGLEEAAIGSDEDEAASTEERNGVSEWLPYVGVNAYIARTSHRFILDYAAAGNAKALLKLPQSSMYLHMSTTGGYTALMLAAMENHAAAVKVL